MDIFEIITFGIVFCFNCLFSCILASNDGFLKFGKSVAVNNKFLRFWLEFPAPIYFLIKGRKHKKNNRINIIGIVTYCLNYIVLASSIVFWFLPDIHCKEVEISLPGRYRGLDFVADTYNEKIPFLSVWILLMLQALIMFIKMAVAVFAKKGTAKELGVGALISLFFIILLLIAVLVYLFSLML